MKKDDFFTTGEPEHTGFWKHPIHPEIQKDLPVQWRFMAENDRRGHPASELWGAHGIEDG